MIIAVPGQKTWKESDTLEDGYIKMNGIPPSKDHYAIDGEWKTPDEFIVISL